jgi:hypothetical protein
MNDAIYEWAAVLQYSKATQWAIAIGVSITTGLWLASWLIVTDLVSSPGNPMEQILASALSKAYWVPALLSFLATLRIAFDCFRQDRRRLLGLP